MFDEMHWQVHFDMKEGKMQELFWVIDGHCTRTYRATTYRADYYTTTTIDVDPDGRRRDTLTRPLLKINILCWSGRRDSNPHVFTCAFGA